MKDGHTSLCFKCMQTVSHCTCRNVNSSTETVGYVRIAYLEDMLFKLGAMNEAPCFCCGYNGHGYYQPDEHKCAERHHRLCEKQHITD